MLKQSPLSLVLVNTVIYPALSKKDVTPDRNASDMKKLRGRQLNGHVSFVSYCVGVDC